METNIVKSDKVDLMGFGDAKEIKEIGKRMRDFMPNAQKLTEFESEAVAQIALAHKLDPFNGEVWGLKTGDGRWLGVMVGIKGLRKAANRQAERQGTNYWFEEPKLVQPAKYNAPANATVYEMILRDSSSMQAYGKSINSLTSCGIPYKEAIELCGKPPVTIGVGISTTDEKSKMGLHARAKKRAESDALKQRFNIDFGEGAKVSDAEDLSQAEQIGETVTEAQFTDLPAESPEPAIDPAQDEEYIKACEMLTPTGLRLDTLNDSQLSAIHENANKKPTVTPEMQKAAGIIVNHRIEAEKKIKAAEAGINDLFGG